MRIFCFSLLIAILGVQSAHSQSFQCRAWLEERRSLVDAKIRLQTEFPFTRMAIKSCLESQGTNDDKGKCIVAFCVAQALFRNDGEEGCVTLLTKMSTLEDMIKELDAKLKTC
jgi:hypothetical protein